MVYSKRSLAERVMRHMVNNFPTDDFTISDAEMLMYIDAAVASSLVGTMMGLYKVKGYMETPEGYLVTTTLDALIQFSPTGEWETTLPQSPLSVSLGLSINSAYFSDPELGTSQPVILVKSNRAPYRNNLPRPDGVYGRVVGSKFRLQASDNSSLVGMTLYVDMVSTRTTDENSELALPDDVIDIVFDKVVARCKDRLQLPQDQIKDNLPPGNKSS